MNQFIYDAIGPLKNNRQLVIEITKGAADWLTQGLLQVAFAFAVKLVHPGTYNRRILLSSIVVFSCFYAA